MITLCPKNKETWAKIVIDDHITMYSISSEGNVRNDKNGYMLKPWKHISKDYNF